MSIQSFINLVKCFPEYLAYEILHRPDSCKSILVRVIEGSSYREATVFIFFYFPNSRLAVLKGFHFYF